MDGNRDRDRRDPTPRLTPGEMEHYLELAWGVIANAHGGIWDKASRQWHEAAIAWRDSVMPRLAGWHASPNLTTAKARSLAAGLSSAGASLAEEGTGAPRPEQATLDNAREAAAAFVAKEFSWDHLADRENALTWMKAQDLETASVFDAVQYLFDCRKVGAERLDALGRILLDMSDETTGFNFETVEARAHTVARQARGFRDIARQAVTNSENLTLDEITGIVLSYITRNEQQAKMITDARAELETLRGATERQRVMIAKLENQVATQAGVFEKLQKLAGLNADDLFALIKWAEDMAASGRPEQANRLENQRQTIHELQNEVSKQAGQLKMTGQCAEDRQQKIWNLEASVKRGADLLEKQAASLNEYAANAQGQREFIAELEKNLREANAKVEDLTARDKRLTAKLETLEGEVPTTADIKAAVKNLTPEVLAQCLGRVITGMDPNKTVFWPTPAEIIRGKLEQPTRPKPPLGLKPRNIHNAQRRQEIIEAMKRFTLAKTPTPAEWLEELETLV